MALDFHNQADKTLIFSLSEKEFGFLAEIFNQYFYRTGIEFDYYKDYQLSIANQKILCKIIEDYVQKTDLNRDKIKTIAIIEFNALLKFCINQNWDLEVLAD